MSLRVLFTGIGAGLFQDTPFPASLIVLIIVLGAVAWSRSSKRR